MGDLTGQKAAILVSGGFSEQDVTAVQHALLDAGATMRIISPDQGLVNGWNGREWGHHFAVDCSLNAALGADYDMLIIPGGIRSLDKLKLTAHTRRFFSSFIMSGKPVIVMGGALSLSVFCDQIKDRTVSGPDDLRDLVIRYGGIWSENTFCIDNNLMTGRSDSETRRDFVHRMMEFFTSRVTMIAAA